MFLNFFKICCLPSLLLIIVFLSACSSPQTTPTVNPVVSIPPGKILFFSSTCPHCTIVKQYITDNNIHQKMYFVERDVTTDQEAFQLMPVLGARCGLVEADLGVPFFWDGNKCYAGDESIINYFKTLP
jgi:hypothetical protein